MMKDDLAAIASCRGTGHLSHKLVSRSLLLQDKHDSPDPSKLVWR